MLSESIRVHSGGMIRIMVLCDTDGDVNAWAHQLGLAEPQLRGAWGPWAPTHLPSSPSFLEVSSLSPCSWSLSSQCLLWRTGTGMKRQQVHDTAKALDAAQLFSFEFYESDVVKTIDFKFCHVKTQSFVGPRKAPEERSAPQGLWATISDHVLHKELTRCLRPCSLQDLCTDSEPVSFLC